MTHRLTSALHGAAASVLVAALCVAFTPSVGYADTGPPTITVAEKLEKAELIAYDSLVNLVFNKVEVPDSKICVVNIDRDTGRAPRDGLMCGLGHLELKGVDRYFNENVTYPLRC